MLHQAEVKSSRAMKLAELKLMAAIEPKTEIEATAALKTKVGLKLVWRPRLCEVHARLSRG